MALRIDYIGASWCKVCIVVKPELELIARSFNVPISVMDADEIEDDSVTKVPTLRVFKDDKLVLEIVTKHVDGLKSLLQTMGTLVVTDDF
uniref:Thioredoxin domain-containing protein n=1 Tax=viral metagenome TaxID=1070528 RepID=A0A6C0L0B9_9ZZZZ